MSRVTSYSQQIATATLRDETLVVSGALQRQTVTALWSALPASIASVRQIDMAAVSALDTAGLAWLIEAVARVCGSGAPTPCIANAPDGYASLCMAYRIQPSLEGLVDVTT